MSASALAKWMLFAAMFASALIYLILGSRMGGVAAPLAQNRGGPAVRVTDQVGVEGARTAADPSSGRHSSPAFSGEKLRFGFLEFEDGLDTPAE